MTKSGRDSMKPHQSPVESNPPGSFFLGVSLGVLASRAVPRPGNRAMCAAGFERVRVRCCVRGALTWEEALKAFGLKQAPLTTQPADIAF